MSCKPQAAEIQGTVGNNT